MTLVIPQGATDNALRTIAFRVMQLDNPLAAKTTGVAGTKATIRLGTGARGDTDNAIQAVNAATGHYELTLSDDEVAAALPGTLSYDTDCAPVDRHFQIGPSTVLEETPTVAAIAAANRDDAIRMLLDGITTTTANGTGSMTVKDSAGNDVIITITRAVANPIVGTAAPGA